MRWINFWEVFQKSIYTNPDFSLMLYNLALFPVVFFSVMFFILTMINLFVDRKQSKYKALNNFPFVTVHIPTFNDPIGARCVEKCMKFDYPKDKFEIIIADDSTNNETQKMLKKYADGRFVKYIHRDNRVGFKPGALQNAMKITRGEIIVVFDADWIPKKDFLKEPCSSHCF